MRFRIAGILTILLMGVLAAPASANDDVEFKRIERRLVGVAQFNDTLVLPDGTVFAEDELEELEEDFELPVGATFYSTDDLFLPDEDDDREPSDDQVGRSQIACEVLPNDDFRCSIDVRVLDVGDLHHVVLINYEELFESEDDLFSVEAVIIGGSGDFKGATGVTVFTDREDFDESGVGFYDVRAFVPAD